MLHRNKQYTIASKFRYCGQEKPPKEIIYYLDQKDDKSLMMQTMGKDCYRKVEKHMQRPCGKKEVKMFRK